MLVHKSNYGSPYVYLNNGIVPEEEAKISVYDHGFLYGAGVFETMRSYNKKVFLLDEHLARLKKSAEIVGIEIPWTDGELAIAVEETMTANKFVNTYLRLSISRGEGPIGIDPRLCKHPTLVIMGKELPDYNEIIYKEGIEAIICQTKRNSIESTNPQAKSFNFLNNISAKREVLEAGVSEGIMLNQLGQLTEGTVSNIFIVKKKTILTPKIECGILEGITRNFVFKLAKENDIQVKEDLLYPKDLYNADEVFITNSSQELVSLIRIDNKQIGNGKPGLVYEELLKNYRNIAWNL